MKLSTRIKASAATIAVSTLIVCAAAVPAAALGSATWREWFSVHSGGSVYLRSTNTTVAWTQRDGAPGYIAAQVRYQESAPPSQGRTEHSNRTYIEVSEQRVGYGGWHWTAKNSPKKS